MRTILLFILGLVIGDMIGILTMCLVQAGRLGEGDMLYADLAALDGNIMDAEWEALDE